jgi:hypothetical protein
MKGKVALQGDIKLVEVLQIQLYRGVPDNFLEGHHRFAVVKGKVG